ncbi:SusC/RagA family TonB-linked outer membrane protein [Sphingobacterium faecale]|uniref:SusC/RagA family TonB-linked outer membrane protein n=1 Tax=Sphingobacterium faecale TaxID=2803775 RepID=A0ABS1QYQ2_9SPHI|nr:SusC/RagA family TonB-linked outer membrane protein [Sphingobacterium faecale]MBL1407200.1 SusC/RagA family TonB-linked outer membrane protein [Sphingobacterium faecale]
MRVNLVCLPLLVLAMSLFGANTGVGQGVNTKKIVLSANGLTLRDALKNLQEVSGLTVFYPSEVVNQYPVVKLGKQPRTITETLDVLLAGTVLQYRVNKGNIVLSVKDVDDEQGIRISGIVQDLAGNPLSGVTVLVENWDKQTDLINSSTASDRQGHWGLVVPSEDVNIKFQYLGYKSVVKSVKEIQRNGIVLLEMSQDNLDEVVVIGYGTTTRRKNTGSVASLTAKEIASQPVSNPLAALSGRMSGVLIAQNNGVPGSAVQIQVRNQASLSANSSGSIPLYVIDGVPFTNFNGSQPANDNLNAFSSSGSAGGLSPFNMINPADIERIDVLKDADATAIYGSRGANGVVLITTKKGTSGRTRIGVNFNTGYTEVNRFIPMLDLDQYLTLRKQAFTNDGTTPTIANAPDLVEWDQKKSTDWQKFLIGDRGHVSDFQANLAGGNDYTRFFFNTGYRSESTVYPDDNKYNRITSRLNLDHRSSDNKFNAALSVSYANDDSNMPASDVTSSYTLPPNYPLYNQNNELYWVVVNNSTVNNPLALLKRRALSNTNNLISNANLSYKILPGLTAKANFGYTITQLRQNNQTPIASQNPSNNPKGSSSFSNTKAQNWIIEPTLDYGTDLGSGRLTALLGGSFQQNSSHTQTTNGTNYEIDALLGSLSAAGNFTASNNIVYYKYAAAFGKINYDWKDKYLINATFRRDGSSRFGPNNRFGTFGAVGLGWIFTNEDFFKDKGVLSFGKIRGSFGTTGNDQIPNYIHLSLYTPTTAYLQSPAMNVVTLPNANIQWETTKKLEFAMDLGFLKDRILFTANYFRNRSSNQLTDASLATQSGVNSFKTNLPALIQNTGLELELNTSNIQQENFQWRTSANFTFYKNKLVDFPGLEQSYYASSYVVGEPINLIRLYHYLGVNPDNGQAIYEDRDGNGTINSDDRYIADLGTPFYGGFNNTFSYKGLELGVFFQFNHRFGVTKILNSRPGAFTNQNEYWADYWTVDNKQTSIPAPNSASYNQFTQSDAVYGDASYLKLRSVNLSYTLPTSWASRAKMSNCSVFVQAQNLFTWAKNPYVLDTETTIGGGPPGLGTGTLQQVLPPLRTVVFGINCQF